MYVKFQWIAILSFTWTQLASSSPIQSTDPPLPIILPNAAIQNISSPVTNLTWGPIPIDLTIRPDISRPTTFPEEAAFINIVHAMREIAHEDYQGDMPVQDYSTAKFPEPRIKLTAPIGSNTLKREYVLWGLYGTLLHMYDAMGFHVSHFTLLWDEKEVGGIGFGELFGDGIDGRASDAVSLEGHEPSNYIDLPVSGEKPLAGTELADKPTTPGPNTQASNIHVEALVSRLSVTFTWAGRTIPKADMFISVIWTLALLAMHPSPTRIRHLWAPSHQESSCRFTVSATTRTTPPFLQYFWVVEALTDAADHLVERKTYRQLSFVIKVDHVPVGRALLFYRGSGLGE
ncbi:MAG: hypothetical protein Q9221_000542 [Calogaya cf. arnoldii]